MRVISGTARGTKLTALPGEDVKETVREYARQVKEFNRQTRLDLFAGSGQLGIEALSRGAAVCTFIDENREAVQVITGNCKAAGVFDRCRVSLGNAESFLANTKDTYHVILLDPPYNHGTLEKILPAVAKVTADGGTVVCESEVSAALPDECGGLVKKKQHRYGTVLVTRYQKGTDE